jgi:hypothetical protein
MCEARENKLASLLDRPRWLDIHATMFLRLEKRAHTPQVQGKVGANNTFWAHDTED